MKTFINNPIGYITIKANKNNRQQQANEIMKGLLEMGYSIEYIDAQLLTMRYSVSEIREAEKQSAA